MCVGSNCDLFYGDQILDIWLPEATVLLNFYVTERQYFLLSAYSKEFIF